jgi:cysteinyl-tRNA synthetase
MNDSDTLKLYNTATRTKEAFHPLRKGSVGLYVCGVTVYDLCHIGHARSATVFDVLVRYLRTRGYAVTYVRNFTDVDDKIIARARETGVDPAGLAQRYIDAFQTDMGALGVLRADIEPKATEHIEDMVRMIASLVEKGFAYVEGGDVYFSVESFPTYGALSGRKLEDMQAGSRVGIDERKRHPMDFALWKAAKPGEPWWSSPWGQGRPGWHIECSAMSHRYLGASFDIHGGGEDLVFPHHENERAQSVGANGGSFARYWIHNGFVTVESEKMSKSLGNFLTIQDALKSYGPQVLRLFLLSKHYRSPLDFSRDAVMGVQSGLIRIYRTLERLEPILGPFEGQAGSPAYLTDEHMASEPPDSRAFLQAFIEDMDDDLNTVSAIGLLFEKVRELNKLLEPGPDSAGEFPRQRLDDGRRALIRAARVLGLLHEDPKAFFSRLAEGSQAVDPAEVERLIQERASARSAKDWARADAIRNRLKEMGVTLEDGPKGTTWRMDV